LIFEPFPEIKTARLILREPEIGNWNVISYLRTDKKVNKFVNRSTAETKEKAVEFIEKSLAGIQNGQLISWFICLKENAQMIGTICLWNISEDRKTAEIGFDLNTAFHGLGIMSEAVKAVSYYGFKIMNLEMIEAFTNLSNESSKKLLNRNNFQLNKNRRDKEVASNIVFELNKSTYLKN